VAPMPFLYPWAYLIYDTSNIGPDIRDTLYSTRHRWSWSGKRWGSLGRQSQIRRVRGTVCPLLLKRITHYFAYMERLAWRRTTGTTRPRSKKQSRDEGTRVSTLHFTWAVSESINGWVGTGHWALGTGQWAAVQCAGQSQWFALVWFKL
jgi:hypothetical protein